MGAAYVLPTLEAVTMAVDAFPPLKSASGTDLWIARALQVGALKSAANDAKRLLALEGVQVVRGRRKGFRWVYNRKRCLRDCFRRQKRRFAHS